MFYVFQCKKDTRFLAIVRHCASCTIRRVWFIGCTELFPINKILPNRFRCKVLTSQIAKYVYLWQVQRAILSQQSLPTSVQGRLRSVFTFGPYIYEMYLNLYRMLAFPSSGITWVVWENMRYHFFQLLQWKLSIMIGFHWNIELNHICSLTSPHHKVLWKWKKIKGTNWKKKQDNFYFNFFISIFFSCTIDAIYLDSPWFPFVK